MPLIPQVWALYAGIVVVWWGLPPRWRHPWLALASGAIWMTILPRTAVVLGLLALWLGPLLRLAPGDRRITRAWGIALLIPLVVAKGLQAVPLGMSYLIFKLIHYVIEQRRGRLPPHDGWTRASWMLLPPAFTAGPIERFDHYLSHARTDAPLHDVGIGLTRILQGLVKKVVLADLVLGQWLVHTRPADVVSGLDTLPVLAAWAFVVRVFLYNYLDFSAYSDLAVGGCRLLGIRVVENFRWPVAARDIGDFWKRWHISLTSWCQAYVYLPTLGRTRSPYAAVFATFLVMGLWHALHWAWVCWGLWHAVGVSLHLTWRRSLRRRGVSLPDTLPLRIGAHGLTLAFVCAGYVFTGLQGVGTPLDSLRLLGRLVGVTC